MTTDAIRALRKRRKKLEAIEAHKQEKNNASEKRTTAKKTRSRKAPKKVEQEVIEVSPDVVESGERAAADSSNA